MSKIKTYFLVFCLAPMFLVTGLVMPWTSEVRLKTVAQELQASRSELDLQLQKLETVTDQPVRDKLAKQLESAFEKKQERHTENHFKYRVLPFLMLGPGIVMLFMALPTSMRWKLGYGEGFESSMPFAMKATLVVGLLNGCVAFVSVQLYDFLLS